MVANVDKYYNKNWILIMQDIANIIKNVESIYESNTAFTILKDYERVLDSLDLYVYDNWDLGELAMGPDVQRHWVTCAFMWPRNKMPDPMGGKRLLDYDCKVRYGKDELIVPRKIRKPDDIRPGTKKGKLDRMPIWVVEIQMPKKLILETYTGYRESLAQIEEPAVDASTEPQAPEAQPADVEADTGAV